MRVSTGNRALCEKPVRVDRGARCALIRSFPGAGPSAAENAQRPARVGQEAQEIVNVTEEERAAGIRNIIRRYKPELVAMLQRP